MQPLQRYVNVNQIVSIASIHYSAPTEMSKTPRLVLVQKRKMSVPVDTDLSATNQKLNLAYASELLTLEK